MKKVTSLIVFLFSCSIIYSTPLNWKNKTNLYDHLVEVNKEWLKISDNDFLCEEITFSNDIERIQMHLQLVEKYLRENPPASLNIFQMEKRIAALDILKDYWKVGNFPQNTYHKTRQPYFVDKFGTACAVGYLALKTGESELVETISKEMNFAYVAELKDHYPRLLDWANEFGFTIDELAWIQPGYPPMNQTWNQIGNGGACDGEIKTMKAFDDEMLYFGGNFSEIDGFAANSIVGWDGNDWYTLGEGVSGVIHDIAIGGTGKVFIGGDFYVNENPEIVNLAYWENGDWYGFETTNMTGAIYALHQYAGRLFVGGKFEIEDANGNVIKDLAFVENNETSLQNNNGAFSVNGAVYDFDNNGHNILIAGEFTQTAYYSSDPDVNHLETDYLAYWNHYPNYNWVTGFEHQLDSLGSIKIANGRIYAGAKWSGPTGTGYFDAGIWKYISLIRLDMDILGLVHGILPFNDKIIYYGNIEFVPLIGNWSKGVFVNTPYNEYGANFNAAVTAAESFQNQIYFAGEFTNVQGQEFPGLVSSPFDGIVPIRDITGLDDFKIFAIESEIHVQHEVLKEDLILMVYNLNGQLISQSTLHLGSTTSRISTQTWPAGMYVYRLVGDSIRESGKLAVF